MSKKQQVDSKNIFCSDLSDNQTKIYKNIYNDIMRQQLLNLVRERVLNPKNLRKLGLKYKSLFYHYNLPNNAIILAEDEIDFDSIKSDVLDELFKIELN